MANRTASIKNYYFPTDGLKPSGGNDITRLAPGSQDVQRNLNRYMAPVMFQRFRHDVKMWREAIFESENPIVPHRVKMMRLFQDSILDGHIFACMEKRKNLTLLRDFKICDNKGQPDEDLKLLFRNHSSTIDGDENSASWFDDFISYSLDATFFGFTLISLGDVVNDTYPQLTIVKRQNVSPDRMNVGGYPYAIAGIKFMEDPYRDWHVWVPTPTDLAASKCGYGLLYKVAMYELLLRNNLMFNADFNEVFNQPIRKGTTRKTDEDERSEFEKALKYMGSNPYILLDQDEDTLELIESKNVGTSYLSFENFEIRLQKLVSKIILGHSDAIDPTAGKLGSQQGGKDATPQGSALAEVQSVDGKMVQNVINTKLIPRMRKHGFNIPVTHHFEWLNDKEQAEIKDKETQRNQSIASTALTMSQAGMQMSPEYFQEITGIPATLIAKEQPATQSQEN